MQRTDLVTALHEVAASYHEGELAFLAVTGNIELNVRDRLAYALSRPGHLAWREWLRFDVAVLSEEGRPLLLVELKACDTSDPR